MTDLDTMRPGWAWYFKKGGAEKEDAEVVVGKRGTAGDEESAETEDAEEKGHWVHFPLPRVDTFRELERFLAIWNYKPGTKPPEPPEPPVEPEAAAKRWAMAAWVAERGSESRYKEYILSLDGYADTDDVADRDEFTKELFAGHPLLRNWALGGRG